MLIKRALSVGLASFLMAAVFGSDASGKGKHKGEVKQLDVQVVFHSAFGETVADAQGIHYHIGSFVLHETEKVYDPSIWGTYPLYYFNSTVGAKVIVTNKGTRNKAKIKIKTESHYLNLDGTNGKELAQGKEVEVEVGEKETKEINVSFYVPYSQDAQSGLDVLTIKVSHPNKGNTKNGKEPGLIMTKRAIFCPPEIVKKSKE